MKVGDLVTPENVAALPVGTIVRWTYGANEWRATKHGPDHWMGDGPINHYDDEIVDTETPPAFIAYLPETT